MKTYKTPFYSINSLLGNASWGCIIYVLIGGAQTGKSYSIMDYCLKHKTRRPSKTKWYWLRLTETQKKKLIEGGASKFVDPDLQRKYGIKLMTCGDTVLSYDEEPYEVHHKDGRVETKKRRVNKQEFCTIQAASTMANSKGVGYFDNEFDGEYILVLDEMNREYTEKNNFDICYAVARMIENLVRDTHVRIKLFMIGNDIGEASDLLTAFNFIPDKYGRYRLKRQGVVIDYIAPNAQYKAMRAKSIANKLSKEIGAVDGHLVQVDRSILVNRRKCKTPCYVIKFGKTPDKWFTLWNDSIIAPYKNENKPTIAMRMYLDSAFQDTLVQVVIDKFNARQYKFVNISTFKRFQMELQLIKKG